MKQNNRQKLIFIIMNDTIILIMYMYMYVYKKVITVAGHNSHQYEHSPHHPA